MGCHMSKKPAVETSSAISSLGGNLKSYEAACKRDADLQTFDTMLQARTNHVISTLADGVEIRALSFDSLKEAIKCLLETNQEVGNILLKSKEDIWKYYWNYAELFELVDFFQTLDIYVKLEERLNGARDSHMGIHAAMQLFGEESEMDEAKYFCTLEVLKHYKAAEKGPFYRRFLSNL